MFLDRDQFKPAAEMRLARDKTSIRVAITDQKACEFSEAVYAWITADGKPVRIGTCGSSGASACSPIQVTSTGAWPDATAQRRNGKR
ncbi:hypothetical protein RFN29_26245 [Mesorhizobium sp. VK22B]|uniref:Uncharacterized protein n=1 Tax=Mesorhizobium captivum TaxID=3072319 RepID=A0ABU4Z711_9HYPH|nr:MULTISPECIES: hypothetical protein [unclassified Mesorhizobium]MDX8495064.1 hypothetical protein [Mesorhizobium sp. VK22B]MDX8505353.1 hypothetical protein [Mesorhizobium sp. VK22E]